MKENGKKCVCLGTNLLLIVKLTLLAFDSQALPSFFDVADNLRIDVERAADVDDALGIFGRDVDFHAVAHIEDFVHLLPVRLALLVDDAEQGWQGEKVVLDDVAVLAHEVQYLGLSPPRAMHHTMDARSQFV